MKDRGLEAEPIKHNFKNNSPLALENTKVEYMKNKTLLESMKQLVFSSEENEVDLLDERRLKQ